MEDRYNYLSFVIEREIDKYVEYMLENTKGHTMDPGNTSPIEDLAADYEDIDFDTIAAKITAVTLVPNWPAIFQADNHLDSGKKSLDQQRALIGALIEDLRTSGKVSNSFTEGDCESDQRRIFNGTAENSCTYFGTHGRIQFV